MYCKYMYIFCMLILFQAKKFQSAHAHIENDMFEKKNSQNIFGKIRIPHQHAIADLLNMNMLKKRER